MAHFACGQTAMIQTTQLAPVEPDIPSFFAKSTYYTNDM